MVTEKEVFKKLEEFVLKENKTVTCKVLSNELKIHVNEAKQYLTNFLAVTKSKEEVPLNATYALVGNTKSDGAKFIKVVIVSQNALDSAKKEFSVITSCHIYSIGVGKQNEKALRSSEAPYRRDIRELGRYSAIKHTNIEIQPPVLNKINLPKKDVKPTTVKKQEILSTKNGVSPFEVQKNIKKETVKNDSENKINKVQNNKAETHVQEKILPDPKKAQPNTLSSLWKKEEEKSKVIKNGNSKPDGKKSVAKKPSNSMGIMGMFQKQAAKSVENSLKKPPAVESKAPQKADTLKEKVKETSSSKKELSPKKEKISLDKKTAGKKRKTSQRQTKTSKKKSCSDSDEDVKPKKKKHRRICTFEDSSESECEEEQDRAQRSFLSEEPIETASPAVEATPLSDDSEEPIPPTPPVISHKGKKKMWRTVQKHYEDEDGFMVSKQEKELVSISDEEDPIPHQSTSKEAPKPSNFANRKQASLTSFFKRT